MDHIKERHPEDYDLFQLYGKERVENPDLIIKDITRADTTGSKIQVVFLCQKSKTVNHTDRMAVEMFSSFFCFSDMYSGLKDASRSKGCVVYREIYGGNRGYIRQAAKVKRMENMPSTYFCLIT